MKYCEANYKSIKIIAKFKNMMVHAYQKGFLLVSSRNKIFKINNLINPEPIEVARIPINQIQKRVNIRIIDRLLRNNIKVVHQCSDESILIRNKNGWWNHSNNGKIRKINGLKNTTPMARGVCESNQGITYVGDYSRNNDRKKVCIYKSIDNVNFEIGYEFRAHEIRHIHSLINDPFKKNRIWILTGDKDNESKILITDDYFRNVKLFLSAGQISRATDLIVKEDCIIWGTDSPIKKNRIVKANCNVPNNYTLMEELPGPVYYCCQNENGGVYFATTAEPGPAAEPKKARIFSYKNCVKKKEIFHFKKDIIPQHGIIYFPKGVLPENFIVFSQRALKPNEGFMTIAIDNSL